MNQTVAEDRGGSPKTASLGGFVNIEHEARGGLAEHFAGRTVARVAISGDLGVQPLSVCRDTEKAQIEEPRPLRFRARALPRLWQRELLDRKSVV